MDGQIDVHGFREVLAAERHYRRVLVPRGVVVESPVLRLAEEAASVGVSKATREARAERVSGHYPGLLVYPQTVRLARLMTRTSFLDGVLGDCTQGWKRAMVEREVTSILPDTEDAENWRALARVWDLVLTLQDAVRDARLLGQEPQDRWNLLRYSRVAEVKSVQASQVHPLM